MKRFIYIPEGMIIDGQIPEEALALSKQAQLSIREGFIGDGIQTKEISIVSFPEIRVIDYSQSSRVDFVHSIDITNEFVTFSADTFLEVVCENGLRQVFVPNLKEKHLVKFRPRFSTAGKKYFSVYSNNEKIHSGEFEIK